MNNYMIVVLALGWFMIGYGVAKMPNVIDYYQSGGN
jgi:hypothetical protein